MNSPLLLLKMKRLSLLLMVLVAMGILLPAAFAEFDVALVVHELGGKLQGQELPKPVARFLGDEHINILLTTANKEEVTIGIVAKSGVIENVALAEVKDPTLLIYASEEIVTSMAYAKQPIPLLQKALQEGTIRLEGVGFKNKVKWFFVPLLAKGGNLLGFSPEVEEVVVPAPEMDKSDEKKPAPGDVKNDAAKTEPVKKESKEESSQGPQEHTVLLVEGGFEVPSITIKAGDSVVWPNERAGQRFEKALIVGTKSCAKLKSPLYYPGNSFHWTFDKPQTCMIVDGIYTTQTMKVIVE